MNYNYVKLKEYFKKSGDTADKEAIEVDFDLEQKKLQVNDHIKFLISVLEDESIIDYTRVHTLKCLSKFVRYQHVKKFLHRLFHETKSDELKKEIRNLYNDELDTAELDAEIEEHQQMKSYEDEAEEEFLAELEAEKQAKTA